MLSIKDILPTVIDSINKKENSAKIRLWEQWPTVVGEKFAAHTRPSLGKHGELFVWVDDSTLAFELSQKYKQIILKRSQAVIGEEFSIEQIYFRVGELR